MSFNKVILAGRLTRDPEMRTSSAGKNFVRFSIAVDRRFKPKNGDGPTSDFFDVTAYGQTADFVSANVGKGRMVLVDGRIEIRKYTDRDGNARTAVDVQAESVTAMDRPKDDAPRADQPTQRQAPAAADDDEYDPFAEIA